MEEAQHLCDRVAILDGGRVTAFDSPDALASAAGGVQRIRFTPSRPLGGQETARLLDLPVAAGAKRRPRSASSCSMSTPAAAA